MVMPRGVRDDRGDTLIEVLFAIGILALAALSILGALMLTASVSGKDRGQSTATTDVRDYAEMIETTVATGSGYNANGTYAASGTASVQSAKCLTAASATTTSPVWGSCPQAGGAQMQMLTLSATEANGSTESLVIFVRKPCSAATAADTCP